jgi:AcrR family transcriptional regulator
MARSALQVRRRADNLQEIFDAAMAIVLEEGPGALTLAAVAAKVGVTTPALYHYFESKTALLRELILAAIEAEADMLIATAEGWRASEDGILGAMVRALYRHYRPKLASFRLIYQFLQSGPPGAGLWDEPTLARLHVQSKRMFDALEAVLVRGRAAGTVAHDIELRTAVVAAHASAAGLLTMLALAEHAGDPLRQRDEALLKSFEVLLREGIRPR